jgi:glyoxylase-like metal-dependent hydrolase (beta-lactamase superfamily II)
MPFSLWANATVTPLEVQKITHNTYALVGEMTQRSPNNLGNNATFGVIVTKQGVVLIDSGGSEKGAVQIHQTIKSITNKPVIIVINSGGQDHRWLGNHYFKQLGAKIIASEAAVKDQRARTNNQLTFIENLIGKDNFRGTQPVYAEQTFKQALDLEVAGESLQLRHAGQAHTPGDSYIWLPKSKVVFSGDIVYVERMLGVGSVSNSASWLKAFEAMAAHKPKHVIPGHGHGTDLATATQDTADYLRMLRNGIKQLIEQGGGLDEVSKVDQSKFSYLKVYQELKGRNAHQVYQEMEWE